MKLDRFIVHSMAVLGPQQLQDTYNTLFTFGDSYTSTEFNTSGIQPTLDHPMGNPSLGQGTSAGGINWAGYLTTVYNDTAVLNFNLAVFGATVDNSIVNGEPIDLVDQVSRNFGDHYCSSLLEASPGWKSDTALFAIWIGINDIQISYMRTDISWTISRTMQSYFDLLEQLHECGARQFLLMNVPPITRTPKMMWHDACTRDMHEEAVVEFNYQLEETVLDWRMTHRDSTMTLYDAWSFMTELLDRPVDSGFADDRCMGMGCVWWDDYHPTSEFHDLLAADVAVHLRRTGLGFS